MIRLFVPDTLSPGGEVIPSPDQARYLLAVMRLTVSDAVSLFNGSDGEWTARMVEASKRACRLRLEVQTRPQAPTPDLDLIIALVKRARLETIVEKATELGVRRIGLCLTRRTNADHTNVTRLQAIATEAAEQTGRLDVPEVEAPQPLSRLLQDWSPARRLMFCDEAGDAADEAWGGAAGRAQPALAALRNQADGQSWAALIGPEGGFAPEERAALRALPFVTPVTLGPRILRADSAAIAALTLWQASLGDWRA
jgi:16S rRNA (uracil1498-N3)-methyltransferase